MGEAKRRGSKEERVRQALSNPNIKWAEKKRLDLSMRELKKERRRALIGRV